MTMADWVPLRRDPGAAGCPELWRRGSMYWQRRTSRRTAVGDRLPRDPAQTLEYTCLPPTGATFEFEQDDVDGTVTLTAPAGEQEYDMEVVGPALAPGGSATITCQPDRVDFVSTSVTMTLSRRP